MCSTFMFEMLKQWLIVLQSTPRSEALAPFGFLDFLCCVSGSFFCSFSQSYLNVIGTEDFDRIWIRKHYLDPVFAAIKVVNNDTEGQQEGGKYWLVVSDRGVAIEVDLTLKHVGLASKTYFRFHSELQSRIICDYFSTGVYILVGN